MLSACRAWNLLLVNEVLHLFLCPCIYCTIQFDVVLCAVIFDNFICTETLMTLFTVHQRIAEYSKMSAGDPCLWIHKDRTIYSYVVWRFLDEFLPPCSFYVIFQFYSEITIIPCICKPAIDLRSRIYKSSCFRQ